MSNSIRTLAVMLMNRIAYRLADDAAQQHTRLGGAIMELNKALRSDAQKPSEEHHPTTQNEG